MNRSTLSFLLLTCPLLACADDIPPIPVPTTSSTGDVTTGMVTSDSSSTLTATDPTSTSTGVEGTSTTNEPGSSSTTGVPETSTGPGSSSTGAPVCGDDEHDPGEDCDGTDLDGMTCMTLGQGFNGGRLACADDCTFDTSGCTSCGDGTANAGEDCDGTDLAGLGCPNFGFVGGMLGCDAACAYDESACSNTLYFSEYVEGSSNNKAIEVYNATGGVANLDACEVRFYFNGLLVVGNTIDLVGNTATDDVFVVCDDNIVDTSFCDILGAGAFFNGDDAVELVCSGVTLDVIGQIGFDPGIEWVTAGVSTLDQTLRRSCAVTMGDPNGADAFNPSLQWASFPQDSYGDLGQYVCP